MSLIYVVEDNKNLLQDTVQWLNHHDHNCHGAPNAVQFDALMSNEIADLVVLDWMLPGEDGLAIAQRLRSNNATQNIGIIFLTARTDVNDRISGHDVADAYLTKPVNYKELSAVITAVLRRVNSQEKDNSPVLPWQLFVSKLQMRSPCGQTVHLTWRECAIIVLLAQNLSEQVPTQMLMSAIKENPKIYEKSRLEMLLSRLRAKFKLIDGGHFNPIRSDRNKGYRLMLPFKIND